MEGKIAKYGYNKAHFPHFQLITMIYIFDFNSSTILITRTNNILKYCKKNHEIEISKCNRLLNQN